MSLLAGAALGMGGAFLGSKGRDKGRTKRIIPPAKKFADSAMMLEAARRLTGKKSFVDELEENRLRNEASMAVGQSQSALMRGYGQAGLESPGMMEQLARIGDSGVTSRIGAMGSSQIARREGAIPILRTLSAYNQPYNKTRVSEGPMWAKMGAGAMQGGAMGLGMSSPSTASTPMVTPSIGSPSVYQSPITGNPIQRRIQRKGKTGLSGLKVPDFESMMLKYGSP